MVPWVKRRRSRQSFPWQDGRSSVRNLGKRREGDANEGASWYGREMAERSHPGPGWLRVVASGDDAEPAERRRGPTIRGVSCRGGPGARGRARARGWGVRVGLLLSAGIDATAVPAAAGDRPRRRGARLSVSGTIGDFRSGTPGFGGWETWRVE